MEQETHAQPERQTDALIETSVHQAGRKRLSTLQSFHHRDFRWLWLGTVASFTAVSMEQIARGWLILRLTGDSPFALSLVMMAFALPLTIAALLGGALADRLSRKGLILMSQSANAAIALLVAILNVTGVIHFWHLIVLGLIEGSMAGVNMPSRQSIVSDMVPPKDLMNAISLNSAGMNLTRIVGPALAGALIVYIDTAGVFFLTTCIHGIAFLCTTFIRGGKKAVDSAKQGLGADIIEGFTYAKGHSTLLGLVIMSFVPALFGFPYIALLPVWAREALDAQSDGLGILMMSMGMGSLVGTLILASLRQLKRRGFLLMAIGFAWGLSLVVFSRSFSYTTALPCLFLLGLMSAGFMSLNMTLIQQYSSAEMRGRVVSMAMMTFGIMPLSAVPFGAIAEHIGTADSLQIGGLLLCLFTLIFFFAYPKFRAVA